MAPERWHAGPSQTKVCGRAACGTSDFMGGSRSDRRAVDAWASSVVVNARNDFMVYAISYRFGTFGVLVGLYSSGNLAAKR